MKAPRTLESAGFVRSSPGKLRCEKCGREIDATALAKSVHVQGHYYQRTGELPKPRKSR